jgi:Zn-dependent peptidase ImmA (M78 family)/transcriptional regulator with XRE-family HTH domain
MAVRVDVSTELITWARERSGVAFDDLSRRFPKLEDWETGVTSPTLKQLESFANATHTPVGFFFLPEPPEERLPLPDFRTMRDEAIRRPSPDLLETIFSTQQRQQWYRDYALAIGEEQVEIVRSLTVATSVIDASATMQDALDFEPGGRGRSWSEAFRRLADHAEDLGVLVMVNGIVGSNTHRKLNPKEFRGFALIDEYAPVVFVNGVDTKAAQIFTLVHELAHIWLGQSALTDVDGGSMQGNDVERWCNQVAAELLVPLDVLRSDYRGGGQLTDELDRLAAKFRTSTLVVLRRIYEAGYLQWDVYRSAYRAEEERVLAFLEEDRGDGGGNFYNTQPMRTSRRFARAITASALEGRTLYRDAFQMLGLKKVSTFNELAHRLEVL